ncbi:MAG TPA: peptidylprolyl isomerase, partial [Terriglobia bacterium]|nr:peptidylprolyl isomerase [Terriglobia bacterium]
LAKQYLTLNLSKVPAVDEAALRNFYKNHGEKFVTPPRVQVRELFLPLQEPRDKKDKTKDTAYVLGQELAERIRKGESCESLAAQHVPEGQRDRAQVHEFRGALMELEDETRVLTLPPGEVVGPLRIEGGYSVFQGVAQVRSGRIPFYEAREKIKTYLEARRVEEARQQLVANLQRQRPVQRFAPDKTLAAVH